MNRNKGNDKDYSIEGTSVEDDIIKGAAVPTTDSVTTHDSESIEESTEQETYEVEMFSIEASLTEIMGLRDALIPLTQQPSIYEDSIILTRPVTAIYKLREYLEELAGDLDSMSESSIRFNESPKLTISNILNHYAGILKWMKITSIITDTDIKELATHLKYVDEYTCNIIDIDEEQLVSYMILSDTIDIIRKFTIDNDVFNLNNLQYLTKDINTIITLDSFVHSIESFCDFIESQPFSRVKFIDTNLTCDEYDETVYNGEELKEN